MESIKTQKLYQYASNIIILITPWGLIATYIYPKILVTLILEIPCRLEKKNVVVGLSDWTSILLDLAAGLRGKFMDDY